MKGKLGVTKAAPAQRAATPDEILQAIEKLTDADNERLEQFAISRILRIGRRAAAGRTYEDLFQESISRLIDGPRYWYPDTGVSFVTCLLGIIRSVSSAWAGHRARNKDAPDYAELATDASRRNEEGKLISPFEKLASTSPTVEQLRVGIEEDAARETAAKALRDAIMKHFENDEPALLVLLCMEDGKDGPAIQAELGMTEPQYRTVTRRIQRNAKKIREDFYGR
jgi:hypothetical protein